jgi:hypothetical protein
MARYTGGAKVESGYYLNARSFAVVNLPAEGMLPGTEKDSFVKVPWPILLAAAPVVGGLFVVAYPIYGFSVLAYGLARKALGAARETAIDLAATVAPGHHAVGEAHLTGKPGEGTAVHDAETEQLEKEIAERREGEKK